MVELGIAVYAVGEVEAKTGNALQDALVLPLARHRLGKARVVLVYVHVLVRLAEQLAHGGGFEFAGQGVAGGIADGHIGMGLGILICVAPYPVEQRRGLCGIGAAQHRQELVAAIAAGEA